MRSGSIEDYLVENGLITYEQRDQVLEAMKSQKGKSFCELVVEMDIATESRVAYIQSEFYAVPFCDIDGMSLSRDLVLNIPESLARKFNVIVISMVGRRLNVATNDPLNFDVINALQAATNLNITPMMATKTAIARAIDKMYSEEQN